MKEFIQYFLKVENLNQIWNVGWRVMLSSAFIYFGFLFIRIHWSERKIKKLMAERDEKIKKNNGGFVVMSVINGRNRRVKLDYQDEITNLERQRKFDLEKIPFIKN